MSISHPAQLLNHAIFRFRDFAEAALVSHFLAQACPNPTLVDVALSELFSNAIEHGNLELSFQEKTKLQEENRWLSEIEHRLTLPQFKHKKVIVEYTRLPLELHFKITDEGKGFNWKALKQSPQPPNMMNKHGHGLAIIMDAAFERVEYLGCGNEVLCVIVL